ncbi:hypothetical protein Aple_050550 [Acrocarpospora pleiomorpha]|uniref:Uncharacterized protein n=1 Tax=Acrocarpospora pleiomorpha TaxID=90975 RepID=A0A5M3XUS1_9ACTN|nr:hypothetical protein Aple_050550 [Acrocarpospora pleiomorpha]
MPSGSGTSGGQEGQVAGRDAQGGSGVGQVPQAQGAGASQGISPSLGMPSVVGPGAGQKPLGGGSLPASPDLGGVGAVPSVIVPSLPVVAPDMGSFPVSPGWAGSAGIPLIAPSPNLPGASPLLNPPYMGKHMSAQGADRFESIKGLPVVAAAVAGLVAILGLQMRLGRKRREIEAE